LGISAVAGWMAGEVVVVVVVLWKRDVGQIFGCLLID
jgi:hypothetical protein